MVRFLSPTQPGRSSRDSISQLFGNTPPSNYAENKFKCTVDLVMCPIRRLPGFLETLCALLSPDMCSHGNVTMPNIR
jgi:hypothetical protein